MTTGSNAAGPLPDEGLPVIRLAMIVSSLTPLFILWMIRGVAPIPDRWLFTGCGILIAVPNVILCLRWIAARRSVDVQVVVAECADDHRDHLLVYLFAMLIPLFDANIGTERDSAATIVALILVIFLFWHLNLHYMNLFFAILGYRVFTIRNREGTHVFVLLAKRTSMPQGAAIEAYRLSNSVFMERRSA